MLLLESVSRAQSAFAVPIGSVGLLAFSVGLFVLWHERARHVSISFFAACMAVAVYMGGFALMVGAPDREVALFWGKTAYLGIPFIVPAIYHFSMDLLGLARRRRWLIRTAWAVGVVYAILAVGTDVLVPDVMVAAWGYITRITWWNLPVIAWSTLILVLALRDYRAEYRRADPVQQARIRLFAIPILIGSVAFIDYGPSLGLPGQPWGFLAFSLFLLSASWAVARYHLPDLTPAFAADQIIRAMAEPLLVCDQTGAIAFANPAAAELFGWREEEMVGQPLHFVFGSAGCTILSHQEGGGLELDVEGRQGEPIAVSVSTRSVEAKRGQRLGTIVVARDIRERRRAARELERREQHYRALIENARETISIVDADGRIMYESPGVTRLLGYLPRESIGRNAFDRLHPDDREEAEVAFTEALARQARVAELETRIRNAAGEYRVFELQAMNLLDHPAVRGIVVNGRDVTDERLLAAQLQQAQKMEAVGRLAGGIAHDFNNVLTAVQGNVALLLEEVGHERWRAELEQIRTGADRAGRLTDQLLAFSRRKVVRPELLRLNHVVEGMGDMLTRLTGERIELELALGADPDTVRADRGQLEQVLLNLVLNARDAVDGAGRIRVATRLADVDEAAARSAEFQLVPGSYVLLSVSDDGVGMDEATRSRIFEPFFTTKAPGEGTGLGLSTVYGSVRQATGFIGVDSRPGEGATFDVYLPRAGANVEARPDPGPAGAERPGPAPLDGRGQTLLVVEDEGPVRTLIARVLERRGYRVLQARDGEEALEVAEGHEGVIHLLIADLVMPGLSGREVADRLALRHPHMATVLISGYTADEVVRQGITTGERDFLPKPFTPDALARKVATALAQRQRALGQGTTPT